MENKSALKVRVQKLGTTLSNMVMPNIGAFIAWGNWLQNRKILNKRHLACCTVSPGFWRRSAGWYAGFWQVLQCALHP